MFTSVCRSVDSKKKWGMALCFLAAGLMVNLGTMGNRVYAETGVPSSIVAMKGNMRTAVVVEKKNQTLYLYRFNGDTFQVRKTACSTGKNYGDKKVAGDGKTPEGVYFFVGRYLENQLSPTYGVMALPLDYPNAMDTAMGRNGSAIWIHGTNKDLKPMDSNGCVALENDEIQALDKEISVDITPVIITNDITFGSKEENKVLADNLDIFLLKWAESLASGSYQDFLAYYSPDYLPDIGWWNEWRVGREKIAGRGVELTCEIRDRGFFRDSGVYVALFRMGLKAQGRETDAGIRKLYIQLSDGKYYIIGDSFKFLKKSEERSAELKEKRNPLVASVHELAGSVDKGCADATRSEIIKTINEWVKSWDSGDFDRYAEFYAEKFSSSGMDKTAWVDRKKYLNSIYSYIDISISEPALEYEKGRVNACFKQDYKSSGNSEEGMKTLVLVKEEKKWKIMKELWKKN